MRYVIVTAGAVVVALAALVVVRCMPLKDWSSPVAVAAPVAPTPAPSASAPAATEADDAAKRQELLNQLAVALEGVKAAPNDARAWARLGSVQFGLRQMSDARASFDRSLALDPGLLDALFGMGACCSWVADYPGALKAYLAIKKISPDTPGLDGVIKQTESMIHPASKRP